ncbi:MAG: ArsR family transcriptional regulator [Candidatus Baltobacteraceae bacterium]
MTDARFFQSTRGKIVSALRRRHAASAIDLAEEFRLSANAVRQQLVALERDGFVEERSVRRGPTKPTLEYSLTAAAAGLFPQQYDRMLNAVLREVRSREGAGAVGEIFEGMGHRSADRYRERLAAKDTRGRVFELAAILREHGVEADAVETPQGAELREHACPYANTVAEHPEVCTAIHTVLADAVPDGTPLQIESLATGGAACRFEVKAAPEELRRDVRMPT